MLAPPSKPGIQFGFEHGYRWFTSSEHTLDEIVRLCPEVLLGRYLAITATDSGEPKWWAERLPGWECRGGVGYSPRLESMDGIVYQTDGPEAPGFDEWYTFETPTDVGEMIRGNPWAPETHWGPGRLVALVNMYFAPNDRDGLEDMFWQQIVRLQPECYISDGCQYLTFATRNGQHFESMRKALQIPFAELGPPPDPSSYSTI